MDQWFTLKCLKQHGDQGRVWDGRWLMHAPQRAGAVTDHNAPPGRNSRPSPTAPASSHLRGDDAVMAIAEGN